MSVFDWDDATLLVDGVLDWGGYSRSLYSASVEGSFTLHAGPTEMLLHAAASTGTVNTVKEQYTLVDETPDTLVDGSGDTLVSDFDDRNLRLLHAGPTEVIAHG